MLNIMEASDLTKVYSNGERDNEVIHSMKISIRQNEFAAIMGPSGSGKSTLLHLLSTMTSPTSGVITYKDKVITGRSDKYLSALRRREFGFVFQAFNLLPVLNAAENVALPLLLDGAKANPKRVEELLEIVGLSHIKHNRIYQMSGGEQQRVAIARALIHDPEIIFADEPTGSLDTEAGDIVLALLRNAVDQQGKTVIMVTHDPKGGGMADRTFHVKDGQLLDITAGGVKIHA